LSKERDTKQVALDAIEMREKLTLAHPVQEGKEWKPKRGEGRLLDIDLFVQSGALLCGVSNVRSPQELLERLTQEEFVSVDDAHTLRKTHDLLSGIQQIERLVGTDFDPINEGARTKAIISEITRCATVEKTLEKIIDLSSRSSQIITKKLRDAL